MASIHDLVSYFDYPVEAVLQSNADHLRTLREAQPLADPLIEHALQLIEEAIEQVGHRA